MKNFNEMTPEEMTQDQMIQFCQYVTDRYDVDDYSDESRACRDLAKKILCYRRINHEYIERDEDQMILTVASMLEVCADAFERMYRY